MQILSGRYGAYIKWGSRNISIPKAEQKEAASISKERAIEIASSDSTKLNAIRDFGEFEGKPLMIVDGRYGAYIKWGDRNCPIPKEERDGAGSMSVERARELAAAAPEKKSAPKRRTGYTRR